MRRRQETWGHSYQIERDTDFISWRDFDFCIKQIGISNYKPDKDDLNWDIIVLYVTPYTKIVYKKERFLRASVMSR